MNLPIHPHWRSTRDDTEKPSREDGSSNGTGGGRTSGSQAGAGHNQRETILFNLLIASAGALVLFTLLVEGVQFLRAQLTGTGSQVAARGNVIVLQDAVLSVSEELTVGEMVTLLNRGLRPRQLVSDERDENNQLLFHTPLIAPGKHYAFQVPAHFEGAHLTVRDIFSPSFVMQMTTAPALGSVEPPLKTVPQTQPIIPSPGIDSHEPVPQRPFPALPEPIQISGGIPQKVESSVPTVRLPGSSEVQPIASAPVTGSPGGEGAWPSLLPANRFTVGRADSGRATMDAGRAPERRPGIASVRIQEHASAPASSVTVPPPATGPALGIVALLSLGGAFLLDRRGRG